MITQDKIISTKQYTELTRTYRFYNNGFSAFEVCRYIGDGRLQVLFCDETPLLCFDEKKYCQFVIPTGMSSLQLKEACAFVAPKEVVCYVIKQVDERPQAYEELLKDGDFICSKRVLEYACILDEMTEYENGNSVITENAEIGKDDINTVLEMWNHYLPHQEVPFLNVTDVNDLWANKRQLFVVRESDGKIISVCCYDGFIGKITVRHVVVDENYRGQHLALNMINDCIRDARIKGYKKARSWIEETNLASQKSFEKCGFVRTNTISVQYIANKGNV